MEQIERVENLKKAEMVKAASISSVPHRGVSLSEVGIVKAGTLPVSAQVFAAGIAQVGAIFGIDYIGKGSEPTPDVLKVRVLWEMIRKRGWSDADFSAALERFIATVRFPTWTPADFIGDVAGGTDVKVYPHSWYLEQVQANKMNAEAIGIYRVDGHNKPVWGWKHEVGAKLPVWEYHPPTGNPHTQDAPELAAPKQGVPSVNAPASGELLDRMRLQSQLEAANREAGRYRRDLLDLGRQMERMAETNEQLRHAFDRYVTESHALQNASEARIANLEMVL